LLTANYLLKTAYCPLNFVFSPSIIKQLKNIMQRVLFRYGLILALVLGFGQTWAQQAPENHEGMWMPFKAAELNYQDMQALGLEVAADQIYNEDSASLEDAIVKLNGGQCTAEMVSPQGLMLTNHHCAYDAIASLSSEESDFLTDGFWAMNRAEELPIEGSTAAFLIHSEDVTDRVLTDGPETNQETIQENIDGILTEANEGNEYDVEVEAVFHGLGYHLFVYEVYRDVRLVGAPPSSIGKYGGDTDNWMWPRHTGDFSVLRVYANADNQPADYSEDNVPYQPRHFLPVSIQGVKEGDYAMIMGYPGSTSRYLTSSAVQMALDQSNLDKIHLLGQKTSIMKEAMDQDDGIRIALASNYASLMNYYKYLIGQTTMMNRYDVVAEKKEEEKEFQAWAGENEERKEKYGSILGEIDELYGSYGQTDKFMSYLNFSVFASDAAGMALNSLFGLTRAPDDEAAKAMGAEMLGGLDEMYEAFYPEIDEKIFTETLISFYENVPDELHPALFQEIIEGPKDAPVIEDVPVEEPKKKKKKKKRKKRKKKEEVVEAVADAPMPIKVTTPQEKLREWAQNAYATAIITDRSRMEAFLNAPSLDQLKADPIMQYLNSMIQVFRGKVGLNNLAFETQIDNLRKSYLAGMMEMHPDKNFYPDANSTMRITYGTVEPYAPQDGMIYNYVTTLAGVMEKEDPNDEEFIVPTQLKKIYEAKDYGEYGSGDKLIVNFLTTNDITGGNSGSPVINGKGELIGLAFDGNWEAMSSDIHVFPDLKRTICVDARYVLLVMDKFAGAKHLIEEMTVVK
jgi:hypothetical protein